MKKVTKRAHTKTPSLSGGFVFGWGLFVTFFMFFLFFSSFPFFSHFYFIWTRIHKTALSQVTLSFIRIHLLQLQWETTCKHLLLTMVPECARPASLEMMLLVPSFLPSSGAPVTPV